jgi:hypothetical protein
LKVDTITKADGTGSLSVPAESGTVVTTASPSLGRRNLIINGAMQVAQRGTSFTGVGNGLQYSTVDRFFSYKSNLDQLVYNSEQASDGPDGFANSFKLTVTTPETAIETSETMYVAYRTESQDMLQLKYGTSDAKSITVSFWVKSSFAGTYAFSIIANDSSRSIGGTYTVNSANTWEQKILTFSGDASGSFNDDNGIGFTLYWHLGVTTDYSSSDNTSWSSYNSTKFAYGHSANAWATTSGSTFQITGVQLEVGSVATPFEHRSYGEELALCQRYFVRYDAVNGGNTTLPYTNVYLESISLVAGTLVVPVPLRATPSITESNGGIKIGATAYLFTGIYGIAMSAGSNCMHLWFSCSHGQAASNNVRWRWADPAGYLLVDSEL